ncbi:Ig-like domain-containing protein [Methanobrevibacter sp.]|uniref:Ig-like domain-containing protein n=1 Tax=Methanobrevibacter sp. TaxID=66852 RepID=UPI003890B419
MENKIIISMLLIIIALLVVLGIVMLNPFDTKTDSVIAVTSNDTLYDGDYFSISLADINGTPLTNQTVEITIVDANGGKNPQQVTTDEMRNGMLQLNGLTVGEYTVNITYSGNDNYSDSSLTQKISIKEAQKQTDSSSSTSSRFADAQWSRRYYWDDGSPVTGEVYLITTKDGDLWTYDNGKYYHGPN